MNVPVNDITTEDRFRDAENVPALADSIKKYGLLQPIVVEHDNGRFRLIAGFRRLTAVRSLGWTEVPATLREELSELTMREIELEENIQREQMTWPERVKAIALLDQIRRGTNPKWTQAQTAAMAGPSVDHRDVSEAVQLSKMLNLFPELGKAKSIHQAMNWAKTIAKKAHVAHEVETKPTVFASVEERVILGDSRELIKTLPDASIDAIVTDPPFGINYDERKAGSESAITSYEDSEETYETLLAMAPELFRVLKADGWLVWFLGPTWLERAKQAFRSAGFTIDEIPLIWDRRAGRCFTNRPDRYFARSYDMAIHGFKGSPIMPVKNRPNIFTYTPISVHERELTVERPTELYAEIIRHLTITGQTILDPFAGSGSCPAAAASIGRDYIAFELDPVRRAHAIKKISANTRQGN